MLAESDGSMKHVLHGDVDAPTRRGTFGVSGRLKSIVRHRIGRFGKRVRCTKKSGPILRTYSCIRHMTYFSTMSCVLVLGGAMIAPASKFYWR